MRHLPPPPPTMPPKLRARFDRLMKPRKSFRRIIREIVNRPIDFSEAICPSLPTDNIAFGYEAMTYERELRAELGLDQDGCLHINNADTPAPDTWHCAYCDRANPGDRLTCVGCQAGRPQDAEDAGLEIRVYGGDAFEVRVLSKTPAALRETTYKGVPLSKLSEAELRAAAKYMLTKTITSPADMNTITDRWEELYGEFPKWEELVGLR